MEFGSETLLAEFVAALRLAAIALDYRIERAAYDKRIAAGQTPTTLCEATSAVSDPRTLAERAVEANDRKAAQAARTSAVSFATVPVVPFQTVQHANERGRSWGGSGAAHGTAMAAQDYHSDLNRTDRKADGSLVTTRRVSRSRKRAAAKAAYKQRQKNGQA
jgi:hypothetical protein